MPCIKASREETADDGGERVAHNEGGENGAPLLRKAYGCAGESFLCVVWGVGHGQRTGSVTWGAGVG
eukprot:310985-Chlamydomonas_euryale.AAC.2